MIKKTADATDDFIGNKNADRITRASKTFLKSDLETNKEEIIREKYISPELRQKIIDDLRSKKRRKLI